MSLEIVTTFSGSGGQAPLHGVPGAVVRSAAGDYYLATADFGQEILVFSHEGRFLRAIGASGRGPGEYREVNMLQIRGDTLYAFDSSVKRMTVLSLDGEVIRTARLDGTNRAVLALPDGSFLVNAVGGSPRRPELPLHHVGANGRPLSSFGEPAELLQPGMRAGWRRQLSHDRDPRAVWAARTDQYVLQRWSVDGRLLRRVEREVPWFRPWLGRRGYGGPGQPIDSRTAGLRSRPSDGLLVVLVHVASPRYDELIGEPRTNRGVTYYVPENGSGIVDTIVEVIDPVAGRVLVSKRFETELHGFVSDDLVFAYRITRWACRSSTYGGWTSTWRSPPVTDQRIQPPVPE